MLLRTGSDRAVAGLLILVSVPLLVTWSPAPGSNAASRRPTDSLGRTPSGMSAKPPQRVEVATRATARATLSYRRLGLATVEARVRIFLSGRLLVDDRLLPSCRYCAVVPKGMWGGSSLSIEDLNGDSSFEVLVDLGRGGNYNIPYSYVYFARRATWFAGGVTFDRVSHVWGAFRVERRDVNRDGRRRREFVSHDPRFFGRFDCNGCSRGPIQIWAFSDGRLLDVTRRFRSTIERDVKEYLHCLPDRARPGTSQRGCLPAWAGDQALLGRSRLIWPVLEAARRNGNLGAPHAHEARTFSADLRSFLRQAGYL
jgi:hypothetical protein